MSRFSVLSLLSLNNLQTSQKFLLEIDIIYVLFFRDDMSMKLSQPFSEQMPAIFMFVFLFWFTEEITNTLCVGAIVQLWCQLLQTKLYARIQVSFEYPKYIQYLKGFS